VSEQTGITRLTRLLPLACLVAAICLFASELMTMFEFTPPGGEALDSMSNAERHGNGMFVIAVFAVGALGLAVFGASKPAAVAVAVAGLIALFVFLLVDLPDANAVGTLDDARQSFFDAEAVPQGGFWMLLVSSLALSISGIALATLSPEQLAELRPGARTRAAGRQRPAGRDGAADAHPAAKASAHETASGEEPGRRLGRRPRSRQRG
jgi:amino acid transporter